MPTPTSPPRSRSSSGSKAAADAVGKAIGSIHPIVGMSRHGLTVIALESSLANRAPDYLTFDQAQADAGVQVQEAATQTVPSVDAITGPMPVLILGGDTIIGGAQRRGNPSCQTKSAWTPHELAEVPVELLALVELRLSKLLVWAERKSRARNELGKSRVVDIRRRVKRSG